MKVRIILAIFSFSLLLYGCGEGGMGEIETQNKKPSVIIDEQQERDGIEVEIGYLLFDEEGDGVSVEVSYSLDGIEYFDATPSQSSEGTVNLEASATGVKHTFTWDALTDLGEIFCVDLFVSITPQDNHGNTGSTAIASYEVCNVALSGLVESPYGAPAPQGSIRVSLFNIFFVEQGIGLSEEWLSSELTLSEEGGSDYSIYLLEQPPVEHFFEQGGIHIATYLPIVYIDVDEDGLFTDSLDYPLGTTSFEFLLFFQEDPSQVPGYEEAQQGYNGIRFTSFDDPPEYEFFPMEEGIDIWLGGMKVGEIEANLEVVVPEDETLPDIPRAGFAFVDKTSQFPVFDELASSEVVDNGSDTIPVQIQLPEAPPEAHFVEGNEIFSSYAVEFPLIYNDLDYSQELSSINEVAGLSYDEESGYLTVLEYLPESILEESEDPLLTLFFLSYLRANLGWLYVKINFDTEEFTILDMNTTIPVIVGAFPTD